MGNGRSGEVTQKRMCLSEQGPVSERCNGVVSEVARRRCGRKKVCGRLRLHAGTTRQLRQLGDRIVMSAVELAPWVIGIGARLISQQLDEFGVVLRHLR